MSEYNKQIYHVVVAAGTGSRFGASLPKQFCLLDGKPVVMHAIERLRRWGRRGEVVMAVSQEMLPLWLELCERHDFESPRIALGGDTRWQSVSNALELVDAEQARIITVHDGARPLVDEGVIARVLEAVEQGAVGAIPVVPVTDSLRRVADDGRGSEAVPRAAYRGVQTPQGFNARQLLAAYREQPFSPHFTDDASVVEAMYGDCLRLVDGHWSNIKITYPLDLEVAALYMHG